MDDRKTPGKSVLVYHPSKVSWAIAEYVRKPPAIASRLYVYVLVLLLVVGFSYSHFSKVALYIETRGNLTTEQAIFVVRAPGNWVVSKLLVTKNQMLKKGDVILVSTDQISSADYQQMKTQAARISESIQKEKLGACPSCLIELREYAETGFRLEIKGQIRETIAQVREALKDFVTAQNSLANLTTSVANLNRQIKVNEGKLAEIRRRKAEGLLAVQMEQLVNEITSAKSQISERKQNLIAQVSQSRNRLETRMAGLMPAIDQYMEQNTIVAPVDGVVSSMKVSGSGQLLQAGQDLMEIVPANSQLVAELAVPNKDISKVKADMRVKVKLDALPERDYGTVEGVVSLVPANIAPSNDPNAPSNYTVTVRLDQQAIEKDGTKYPFRLGMTLSGLVVTGNESLLKIGMRKVFNIHDELLKN